MGRSVVWLPGPPHLKVLKVSPVPVVDGVGDWRAALNSPFIVILIFVFVAAALQIGFVISYKQH